MKQDLTGLLLAGGRSRRFGADKARHPLDEKPMIAHVYKAVAAVTGRVLVSVRTVPETPFGVEVEAVVDQWPDAGPLAGLQAGLAAATTPWLLVVACDLPFITPESLQDLIRRCTPGTRAVVAQTPAGRIQPLCACYHTEVLPVVERQLAAGQRALRDLLKHLKPLDVVTLPDAVLRNINTPSDLL